ncbi:MAG: hypothetical protein HY028_08605 [Gammaproteobacteria bacterium]|nr:hypothetical protein [Gammaproteobacteria bacterium]
MTVLLQILIGIWVYKATPSKELTQKYSKILIFQSRLPFTKSWKDNVDPQDKVVFEQYRKRGLVQLVAGFICILLLILVSSLFLIPVILSTREY